MQVLTGFVDETGTLHEPGQHVFGVGLLIVRNVEELTHRLHTVSLNLNARLRQRRLKLFREIEQRGGQVMLNEINWLQSSTSHHEYKYSEIREHNVLDYRAVLDQFFAVPGSEFHAVLVERSHKTAGLYGGDSWPTYVMVTKTLLQRRVKEPTFVCCDWQSKPKGTKLSLESELCGLQNVAGCLRMTSDTSAFLQITDLLLGVASFDWREAHGHISESRHVRAKREVGGFVKTKLGLSVSTHFLTGPRRFYCKRGAVTVSIWQPEPKTLLRLPELEKQKKLGAYSGVNPAKRG